MGDIELSRTFAILTAAIAKIRGGKAHNYEPVHVVAKNSKPPKGRSTLA